MVDNGLNGFEHDFSVAPEVTHHDELRSFEEEAGDEYVNWFPIWRSIEGKPLSWRREPSDPEWH